MVCSRFLLWPIFLTVSFILAAEAKQVSLDEPISGEQTSEWLGYKILKANQELMEHRFSELLIQFKQQNELLLTDLIDRHERNMVERLQRLEDAIKPVEKPTTTESSESVEVSEPMQHYHFGLDWTVVLERFDGSEDFDRRWEAYRDGFGTIGGEYWIGLEQLHQLTSSAPHELLIELEDFEGRYRYARYTKFVIGSEEDSYQLEELGSHSGNAGDSLKFHKGSRFSTRDNGPLKDCVESFTGGWWYQGWNGGTMCYHSHLTGTWQNRNIWASMTWTGFEYVSDYTVRALKKARMSIREL